MNTPRGIETLIVTAVFGSYVGLWRVSHQQRGHRVRTKPPMLRRT